ncbi:hypothetical protein MHBO_002886 [Bonamia ostreae]|uniref:UspA domain-containing protein n=1 Tax=Bonamia ostreae TaxID=126728 RepID=A0ABV2ANU7_9EUKA
MPKGNPALSIVEMSKNEKVDCVIMGTRGKGCFGRMLSGSVSTYVMQNASCPVIVVRARKEDEK